MPLNAVYILKIKLNNQTIFFGPLIHLFALNHPITTKDINGAAAMKYHRTDGSP